MKTSCFNEHSGSPLLNCSCGITHTHADICFTVALGSVLAGCYTQVPHRSTLYQQVMSTRVTRGRQVYLSTPCSSLFPKTAGKSTEFSRTHILRDTLRFTGEQAHWVDYKEKLNDVLFFFHSSSLREILQGQARQDKYVLVPNDVTIIPTYVELRRPIYEAQPIPEQ